MPSGLFADQSRQMPPAAPVGSNNPNLVRLMGEQSKFTTPTLGRADNLILQARCQAKYKVIILTLLAGCIIYLPMDDELIRKLRSDFARQGGKARAKALSSKERKAIATKASKAAAKARTRKAKERKAQNG